MSVRVAIEHRTVYRFDRPVRLGPHVVRLRPAPHTRTPVTGYALTVGPDAHRITWQQDPFGNHTARLVHPEPVTELAITVDLVADMTTINPFDFFLDQDVERWPFLYQEPTASDLSPFLVLEPSQALDTWADAYGREERGTIEFLLDLNSRIAGAVEYETRLEIGVQTPDETFERAAGSCRDSAWLLVQLLRRFGVAARFASGYLVQLAGTEPDSPKADSTDLHAWAEAYLPGAGWIGLDATSGLLAGEGHIPLCCTSTPTAAAPVSGTTEAAGTTLEFSNRVRRLHEDPDVTAPYTPDQWERIDALGHDVDAKLEAGGVALTMGGEPTFVAADDMDAPEWNVKALGPTKQGLAIELTKKLADAFAPGAVLRFGQGKWYPSDPLPRWEIGVHWLPDGEPIWRDRSLQADPTTTGSAKQADALAFVQSLVPRLGLPTESIVPAFEDTVDELWRESRLPGGEPPTLAAPDPGNTALASGDARAALIAKLDARKGEPVGYAIPLHRTPGDEEWATGRWALRRGHLFLIPGDSPIGLRLPLDALTWRPPDRDPEPTLFAEVAPLPVRGPSLPAPARGTPTSKSATAEATGHPGVRAARIEDPPPITALSVQVRPTGHLHVFFPPLTGLEDGLELLRAIEDTAKEIGTPVVLEGYALPSDVRAGKFVVTPDPGVIEVNIHPSRTWPELKDRTVEIVRAARETGLVAEKFAMDGTHTGTGGGSHLTVGGATPAESPFLRRPDMLRSLLTYWQIHPSLSYVFSGRFVGPTSQAPRIDEARHESLYELEIAFAELDRVSREAQETGQDPPAWAVDRLLRNILTDLTGNTHRAEFCIDKLYNPGLESGRLGVLELRGFEMPPHEQMALVQALLVRTMVARFWEKPFAAPLVRWGTELHDRFLLPWWAAEDLRTVAADLRADGFAFDSDWLDPFLDFRFPRLGEVDVAGVRLELRRAIEPWNVLGEEASTGGTARLVDSSLERLQVRVDGLDPERHVVTCNGHPLPLHPTAAPGVQIAGVRYRAWQLWSALHPTIGVHAPLVFDVVDRRSRQSLGGCTYHVTEPDGRVYTRVPKGAKEAEARRASRFQPVGTTGSAAVDLVDPDWNADYPRTLDLRRVPPRTRS